MVQRHRSTVAERAQWVAELLAHAGEYGVVTALSRRSGASRETLYQWRRQGAAALAAALAGGRTTAVPVPALARQILTLYAEGHASYRGIQRIVQELTGQVVSLATIHAVLTEAQRRARQWLATHQPGDRRALALDELYGGRRDGAYLSVVDAHSGAVWWVEGPLPVDQESWTLVLWEAQGQGLTWQAVVTDGAGAMAQACAAVSPQVVVQRDIWHVLHRCGQAQGRLERALTGLTGQLAAAERNAQRVAQGQRPLGRPGAPDLPTQQATVAAATRTVAAVRILTGEVRRLLGVVVLDGRGLLTLAARQADLAAALALLQEVADTAPAALQAEVHGLQRHLTQALPGLLAFATPLDQVQQDWQPRLPHAHQTLLAWAWQHRAALGVPSTTLALWLPAPWQAAARVLLHAWATAVRASSLVECWHSLLRPHLAVHRTLAPGALALLAVWHNHRVRPRGLHRGTSPLQRSGVPDAPTDWLAALGYPPAPPPSVSSATVTLPAAASACAA